MPLSPPRPRLGFAGLGWIGRMRLAALAETDAAEIAALCEPDPESRAAAAAIAPGAATCATLEEMAAGDLDGIVIATPSALHAAQSIAVLEAGKAVFCQKPLARDAAETSRVIDAARRADRCIGVDFSYRYAAAFGAVRTLVSEGALGRVHAVDLTFHNAYGPDKAWYRQAELAGGGCLMDLGTHLVDYGLTLLGDAPLRCRAAHLSAGGRKAAPGAVEDFAAAMLATDDDRLVRLACSWTLPAGREAVIAAEVYGDRGGAALRNVEGSFFDFVADRFDGTRSERIAEPPDPWGGRALAAWARVVGRDPRFDPAACHAVQVAETLDAIYAAASA
ncbi:Gfo/Idh/MocA family protein [Roseivivax isoporae]|uniref:Oxidoreductase n=1 Tax=Roseivivax isoporae LMG 25204 TaxID=1449351 RepID=X7F8I8_9RHOB|nr:Gfo/Idh/MocA family oxidoreductase [Roseivivax isoporae]ETX29013.1 oxidoreductase [Roseivivax isoporae LMG 25204]